MNLFQTDNSMTAMFAGSAAFFIVVMTQIFVFDSIPSVDDWGQIIMVPLLAMGIQYRYGPRLDPYISRIAARRSRILLALFVLSWLLFFIPACFIVYLTA